MTTTRPATMDPDEAVDRERAMCLALDQIRLTMDWSWQNLSDDIKRVIKSTISPSCLCYVVQQAHLKHGPRDRTMYKIGKYLQARKAPAPVPERRPRRRA